MEIEGILPLSFLLGDYCLPLSPLLLCSGVIKAFKRGGGIGIGRAPCFSHLIGRKDQAPIKS